MKKLFILSAALLFMVGFAQAQQASSDTAHHKGFRGQGFARGGMHNMQHGGGMQGNMAMGHRPGFGGPGMMMHLTDAQRQQMKTINDGYHKQLVALQANDKISLGEYKTQLAALHKSHEAQIQGVYTDEQKKKMADAKNQRQINQQVMATANMERLKLELSLSDDQVAKIKAQQEQLRTQMKALHDNADLLPEQKRAQMQTLVAQQKDQLKSVLTADQATKLENMQKHRMHRFNGGGWQGRQA